MSLVNNTTIHKYNLETFLSAKEEIKVYEGISGKIRSLFGYTIRQEFSFQDGTKREFHICSDSLARFILSLPEWQKDFSSKLSSKARYYYVQQISREVKALFSKECQTIENFCEKVRTCKPEVLTGTVTGLLYKVKKHEQTVGYLLGTQHWGPKGLSLLSPKLRNTVLKSQRIAFECPLNIFQKIFVAIKELFSLITDSEYRKIVFDMAKTPSSPTYGLEASLEQISTMANIPLFGIESLTTQLKSWDLMKVCMKSEQPKGNKDSRWSAMSRAALAGDEQTATQRKAEFITAMQRSNSDAKAFINYAIFERNREMIEKAEQFFNSSSKDNRLMIAVGTMHILGDDGIIAGLRRRNFDVVKIA